jgi:4-amino-4-deoxy-L-arabinose transferase-like glycosyltransferase
LLSDKLPNDWRRNLFVPAVVLLFLILALELFFSARLESQTFDEPAHLYAGYSYWLRSDFGINPEHPPLVKLVMSLPLLLARPKYPEPINIYFRVASPLGGIQLLSPPGADALLAHARAAVSIFVFLLALLVMLAGLEMFGRPTALFALVLFVFDPLLLGHGPLLGTDVGATCCLVGTVYAFYRYVKRPSVARLALCGLAAGLSLAAKHSAVLIFPVLLLLCAIEVALWRQRSPEEVTGLASLLPSVRGRGRYALGLGASLLAIAAVSILILWAFYGYRYQARPGGVQITPTPAEYLKDLHSPASHLIAFAERYHLLPEAYLFGATDIAILTREGRVMFLLGKLYPEGRWYYFPAALVIKSTLGFLLLLVLLPFARSIWRSKRREVWFLAIPAMVFFGTAMTSKLDIGIRHVMPAIPFLIVLASAGAVSLARQSRGWVYAVAILLGLHVASSLFAFPNYLPYSNELFGGPNNTYRVLPDSNAGWGGGLKALHTYLSANHITQCWFAYTALSDPAAFQIPCKRLPTFLSMYMDRGQQQPVPAQIEGPVFISSEETTSSFFGPDEMNPYQPFVSLRPIHVVAGEILEFDGAFTVKKLAAFSRTILAFGLLQQGNADQAVAQAQSAVALDPGLIYAHEALASGYAAHHQADDAMREYRTAMHLFETQHPEFAKDEEPPRNPLAPLQP